MTVYVFKVQESFAFDKMLGLFLQHRTAFKSCDVVLGTDVRWPFSSKNNCNASIKFTDYHM